MKSKYKLLNHKEPLTKDEIKKLYDDCWVYLVNAQYDERGQITGGIPVVCGNVAYAGSEDDVYDQFDSEEYGKHAELYLFKQPVLVALEKLRLENA